MIWTCGACGYTGSPYEFKLIKAHLNFEGVLEFTTECPKCHSHCDHELKMEEKK